MVTPLSPVPFVSKFLKPIIAQELKMLLLRYEYEDGSQGCIGIREEALATLREALSEVSEKMKQRPQESPLDAGLLTEA